MIALTAKLRAKSGRQHDLEKQLRQLAAQVRDLEPGCESYLLMRSRHDPQLFLTIERYEDEEALAAHSHSAHYTAALRSLMDSLEAPPRVALFEDV